MRRIRFVLAGLMLLAGTTLLAAAERTISDAQIVATLRDIHNLGADLYNSGDPAGGYRVFQGALAMVRPLLPAELQTLVDDGMTRASQQATPGRRAFVLHETIETIRARLRNGGAPPIEPLPLPPKAKADDVKLPPPRKVEGSPKIDLPKIDPLPKPSEGVPKLEIPPKPDAKKPEALRTVPRPDGPPPPVNLGTVGGPVLPPLPK